MSTEYTSTTGVITNIKRLASSVNGNPRYSFEINGLEVRTGPDSSFGYEMTNWENKLATISTRVHYGKLTIAAIKAFEFKPSELRTLNWKDLFNLASKDNGGRWHANEGTPAARYIEENGYRSPSRAWPFSHAKALMTRKFAKWLVTNHPVDAMNLNVL